MDRAERIDAENRFVTDSDACLIIEGRAVYHRGGQTLSLTRRLFALWYNRTLPDDVILAPGPCGPRCHNPRHRVARALPGTTG